METGVKMAVDNVGECRAKPYDLPLVLVADVYGCPNRCRHCWLGHMPNRRMEKGIDAWMVDYFRPHFSSITYQSWLREPDFGPDYRELWEREKQLSVNGNPQRFELASFWRLVRDPDYVRFLKEVNVQKVQLTFFGLEGMTDRHVGRKGAFRELLRATDILLENQIAPRWQAFIHEENKDEIVQLLALSKELRLEERCRAFGSEFAFFVHAGSCDGENRKLYGVRLKKEHLPEVLLPYYWQWEETLTEAECCRLLAGEEQCVTYHVEKEVVLNISNNLDVFYNFTHMTPEWKIGNLKDDAPSELVRQIMEEDTTALRLSRGISAGELVQRYGNPASHKIFFLEDYKGYLLNRYLEEVGKAPEGKIAKGQER
ncbi:MAG: radical SAM protein [Clostridia bacterium]|nr:radical SAM protein [Clostridia bacterium]